MSPALQQSAEFVRAARLLGWPVARRHAACGTSWVEIRRRLPLLGDVRLVSRGPPGTDWLSCAARPGTLVLNAEATPAADLWRAGLWPLLTPASVAVVALGARADMRARMAQRWRNRLNASGRAGLSITEEELPADAKHWLLEAEAAQARARGYRGWPPAFAAAWTRANPGAARLLTARAGGAAVAGLVLLLHGQTATWQIGVTSAEGRARHAMNALLWAAMEGAAARGCTRLDLGTLDGVTAPGLARFKLGTGAAAVRLSGTWVRHPALAPLAARLPPAWAKASA